MAYFCAALNKRSYQREKRLVTNYSYELFLLDIIIIELGKKRQGEMVI